MKKNDAARIAEEVLKQVGGKENITQLLHCTTRLRFNLKDQSIPNEDEISKIDGVFGSQVQSNQFQIIIGPDVNQVYEAICKIANMNQKEAVDEVIENKKEKKSLKEIGKQILDSLSGCLTPILPLIIGASMFKMVVSLLGTQGFGLISETSNLGVLLTTVGDAGFYFLPVGLAYSSAKKFNTSIMAALLLSFVMIHPTFMGLVGKAFDVYGIPCSVQNYTSTLLPIILSVWIMSYVEKIVNKIVPKSLNLALSTAITIAIMLPIALCVVGPLGSYLGNYIGDFLLNLQSVAGPLGVALIAGLYTFLVLTGMHIILVTQLLINLSSIGDPYLLGALWCWAFAILAVPAAIALKTKNSNTKALAVTCFITNLTAGVSEPTIFGLIVKYKKPFITVGIGAALGGLVSSLLGVPATVVACAFVNVFGFVSWITTSTMSVAVNFVVSCMVAFVTTFILTYKFGYRNEMDD